MLCIGGTYGGYISNAYGETDTQTSSLFIGSPYPQSQLHTIRAQSMRLWGKVHDASMSSQASDVFTENIDEQIEELFKLYALITTLAPETISDDQQDIAALCKLLNHIHNLSEQAFTQTTNEKLICFKVATQFIAKKFERMLA